MSVNPRFGGRKGLISSYSFWATTSITTAILLVHFAPRYTIAQSYTATATILFCTQWIIYGFYIILIYPFFLSPLRGLPEPSGNSWFNGQWSTLMREPSGIPMQRWINEIPNDGLIRYKHLFNRDRLLLTNPKALSEVLTTKSYDFVKPELLRSGIGQVLGIGILFAEGDEHKKMRKDLMPAFSFRHIKELYPAFWTKSIEMVDCIAAELKSSGKNTIKIDDWASRATLDIIGVAGLGQDFNSLADPNTELNKVYRSIFSPSRAGQILGLLSFFLPNILLRAIPIKRNDDVRAASAVARDTSRRLIQTKRQSLSAGKSTGSHDIISTALASNAFTEDQLVNNMMTFLAAGHETTASALTWAMYLMCQNPTTQTRLRSEILTHIPSSTGTKITNDIIDNMPYLHAICNETLRLYAPVPLTIRDTAVPTTICNQFVPQGTKIILAPWAVNYSVSLWGADAAEFNPDRWLGPGQANSGGSTSNYAFLTFLHGPRSCIGASFARAELACLVASVVGRFELELEVPGEKIEIKGGVTARPRDGLRLRVRGLEW